MTDDQNKIPDQPTDEADVQPEQPTQSDPERPEQQASKTGTWTTIHDQYDERLERLGGEPAPVITPEEFARLQRAGQVHIDARGRVRTTRRSDAEAGVSLRKRRAWYA